jgi:hypothetical protein
MKRSYYFIRSEKFAGNFRVRCQERGPQKGGRDKTPEMAGDEKEDISLDTKKKPARN